MRDVYYEPGRQLMGPVHYDPRWEWHEVTEFGARERMYIRGQCRHLETVPVEAVTGEVVARLCLTCDAQL